MGRPIDVEIVARVVEREEWLVRQIRSDLFTSFLAEALALHETPEAIVEHIAKIIEAGTAVRRSVIEQPT